MNDRELWIAIRAALLAIVAAIERYKLRKTKLEEAIEGDNVTSTPPVVVK